MASEQGMNLIRQYSDEGRQQLMRMTRDPSFDGVKSSANEVWRNLLQIMRRLKDSLEEVADMEIIYEQMRILFRDEISRNNLFFVSVGFGLGTTGGILLGMWMARPSIQTPIMRAIAAISYVEKDIDLCKVVVPQLQNSNDILIRVRAVSINRIDYRISRGYGRTLRCILQNYNTIKPELPLVLGRGCSGIVEAVGRNTKSGLEIGDEVWVVSPWYESGLGSELVVAPESRVERKPFIIGFEGAASLPYSGCIALSALKEAELNEENCFGKRVLIEEGCSPAGCVLTQLIAKWGGHVTATCYVRSAPVIKALGAEEIVVIKSPEQDEFGEALVNKIPATSPPLANIVDELENLSNDEKFDVIFITTLLDYDKETFMKFLKDADSGAVVSTVEQNLSSDNLNILMRVFYSAYVRVKRSLFTVLNINLDWNGPHLCHNALDRLAGYVNDGVLQTVVDLVYTPQDAKRAVSHICSNKSIGNTIITFRS